LFVFHLYHRSRRSSMDAAKSEEILRYPMEKAASDTVHTREW
jgi:hypothetical protein